MREEHLTEAGRQASAHQGFAKRATRLHEHYQRSRTTRFLEHYQHRYQAWQARRRRRLAAPQSPGLNLRARMPRK